MTKAPPSKKPTFKSPIRTPAPNGKTLPRVPRGTRVLGDFDELAQAIVGWVPDGHGDWQLVMDRPSKQGASVPLPPKPNYPPEDYHRFVQ